MKKKYFSTVIISIFLVLALAFSYIAYAEDEVTWEYDIDTKTLYIIGDGAMDNYENSYSAPWNAYILDVEKVVISEGITSIGNYSFAGAEKLSCVDIADSVKSIGEYAFASCPSLAELTLSENVTSIADYSFAYNGISAKDFTMKTSAGSYALHYIIKNNMNSANFINFETDKVTCGEYVAKITQSGGMMAYYPYTPKYDGIFNFYSTGTHDTRGYVYDSDYNRIAYNDDYGSSTNFGLYNLTLEKGKTYYFGARIMNSSLMGSFHIFIESVEYTVSGTVYAMNSPSGEASDIVIDEAIIDGVQTDGTFTRTVTSENEEAVIEIGDKSIDYTFSPDNDEDIVIMMCDVNGDGIVNGRDYAYMKTSNSKYISLFENFLNYRP